MNWPQDDRSLSPRDFPQIQGGQQISIFIINLLASLNLLEKTEFTKNDDARHAREGLRILFEKRARTWV